MMSRYEYQIDFGEFSGVVIRQYLDLEAAIFSALGIENNIENVSVTVIGEYQRGEHEQVCEVAIVLNNAVQINAFVIVRELPGAALAQSQGATDNGAMS